MVQVVDTDRADGRAVVLPISDATIRVTDRRVVATTARDEWSWRHDDIDEVVHGPEGWTILSVPGVSDHGVSVQGSEVARFREILGRLTATSPPSAGETVLDLTSDLVRSTARDRVEHESSPGEIGRALRPAEQDVGSTSVWMRADDGFPPPPPPVLPPPPTPVRPAEHIVPGGPRPASIEALASLETKDVSAWFGTHHVLDRVSLTMPAGQVTALIGPSGCGKSTYLRVLNRMHEMIPSASLAGEVLLDGDDIYDAQRRLTDARRQIGMVFQKPNPFPAMSIYDNVVASFRLTGRKSDQAERDEVVESCLRKAGLWKEVSDRLRQPGGGLSGGQQQRLCIARALAIRPRVLLMDEPCSALDPTSTRRIEETIQELADEVTIVIVTHNMQQASRVSHQCAFFLAEHGAPGVVVEHGPTGAMFGSPRDQRTSDYVNGRFG